MSTILQQTTAQNTYAKNKFQYKFKPIPPNTPRHGMVTNPQKQNMLKFTFNNATPPTPPSIPLSSISLNNGSARPLTFQNATPPTPPPSSPPPPSNNGNINSRLKPIPTFKGRLGYLTKASIPSAIGFATEFMPGASNELEEGTLKSIVDFLDDSGEKTGYGAGIAGIAGLVPTPASPFLLAGAGIAGAYSGAANTASNLLRHFYGKPKAPIEKVLKAIDPIQIGETGIYQQEDPVTVEYSPDDDVTYTDILSNILAGSLDPKAPVSNELIESKISSLGRMAIMQSAGNRASLRFGQEYKPAEDRITPVINTILDYKRVLNSPYSSKESIDAANSALNFALHGKDIYDFDRQLIEDRMIKTQKVMQDYSKTINNDKIITKLLDNHQKNSELMSKNYDRINQAINDNRKATKSKLTGPPTPEEVIAFGGAFQLENDKLEKENAVIANEISRLQNMKERKMGNGVNKNVIDHTPNWDTSFSRTINTNDLHQLQKSANLGKNQIKAIAFTIKAESEFNSGSKNMNDRGATSVGAIQWRDTRQKALVKKAKELGLSPSSAEAQMAYLAEEIRQPSSWKGGSDTMNAFMNSDNQAEALFLFNEYFVIPSDESVKKRLAMYGNANINI